MSDNSKQHPLMQRAAPQSSDSGSWADGVPEVPSAPDQPIGTNDDALIGPELGMGGMAKPMGPFEPTDVYCEPYNEGDPDEKFTVGPPVAVTSTPQFVDVSSLIEKARGS